MKLFIFDMGDVILLDVRTLMKISEYTGASYRSIREDYGYYDRALMDGYMDASDYYRHLEDKYSVRIESDLFSDFFTPHVNEHLIDIVDRLRSAGHRCVIGSNTFAPHWRLALAFPGRPLDHFDALYASHLMHITKPVKAFWLKIMEAEGYDADDTFFIDDRAENIEAAESLGIKCHLFTGDNDELARFLAL